MSEYIEVSYLYITDTLPDFLGGYITQTSYDTQAVPSRTTMAKTFDGPPTLERSGSEHRRAVTSSRP